MSTNLKSRNKTYEFIKFLGQGAFGDVSLAKDKQSGKYVIIKQINDRRSGRNEAMILYRFRNECDKYLVCIVDYIVNPTELSIVLEFIPYSIDLLAFNEKHDYNLYTTFLIVERLLNGLNILHKNNIVHKDIKSENIIIDKFMNPHYIDFGGSATLNPVTRSDYLSLKAQFGTPEYLDPLLDTIDRDNLDELKKALISADVFSLGCVFYEICFQSKNDQLPQFFQQLTAMYGNPYFTSSKVKTSLDLLYNIAGSYKSKTGKEKIYLMFYQLIKNMTYPNYSKRKTLKQLISHVQLIKPILLSYIPDDKQRINVYINDEFGMGSALQRTLNFNQQRKSLRNKNVNKKQKTI